MKVLRNYPDQVEIEGRDYRYERVLKDDFFSMNLLYRAEDDSRYVLKLSDFRFLFGLLFRPFAIWMSHHEYSIYRRVQDLEGVPTLGPRLGLRGYFHRFIEGRTLYEFPRGEPLPEDFFERLAKLIEQIHARRIFFMDLNKEGNIIVGDDRRPYLIDYQIAQYFRPPGRWLGHWRERLFQRLIREDIYHLYKHKRRYQPESLGKAEAVLSVRSRGARQYNRFVGGPYKKVKRLIYPSGSNETIWYKWRRMKDHSRRMP